MKKKKEKLKSLKPKWSEPKKIGRAAPGVKFCTFFSDWAGLGSKF